MWLSPHPRRHGGDGDPAATRTQCTQRVRCDLPGSWAMSPGACPLRTARNKGHPLRQPRPRSSYRPAPLIPPVCRSANRGRLRLGGSAGVPLARGRPRWHRVPSVTRGPSLWVPRHHAEARPLPFAYLLPLCPLSPAISPWVTGLRAPRSHQSASDHTGQPPATPSPGPCPMPSQVPHDWLPVSQLHPSFFMFPKATSASSFEALKGSTPPSSCPWVWCPAGAPRRRLSVC